MELVIYTQVLTWWAGHVRKPWQVVVLSKVVEWVAARTWSASVRQLEVWLLLSKVHINGWSVSVERIDDLETDGTTVACLQPPSPRVLDQHTNKRSNISSY